MKFHWAFFFYFFLQTNKHVFCQSDLMFLYVLWKFVLFCLFFLFTLGLASLFGFGFGAGPFWVVLGVGLLFGYKIVKEP